MKSTCSGLLLLLAFIGYANAGIFDCMPFLFGRPKPKPCKTVSELLVRTKDFKPMSDVIRRNVGHRQGYLLSEYLEQLDTLIDQARDFEVEISTPEELSTFKDACANLDRANYFASGVRIGDPKLALRRIKADQVFHGVWERLKGR